MFASGKTAAVASAANYIEDVFSTYLYTGNGSTQTITNGIDLSTKGGLTWIKTRSTDYVHALYDTARGVYNYINTSSTGAQFNQTPNGLTAFNSNGFSVKDDSVGTWGVNGNAQNFASWTFREQAKFFDVVTYTGTGASQYINHNLGSVPGCIILKSTTNTDYWMVYHRSVGNTGALNLNTTGSVDTSSTYWQNTTPTSTQFRVGSACSQSGQSYVAYVFAHDAGGFGLTGTDNVISCGSFTTDGSGVASVTLGYEPQWVLLKKTSTGAEDWYLFDNMRGIPTGSADAQLNPNLSAAETSSFNYINLSATGFDVLNQSNSATYIYIAIRRGPMKVPTSGTSVFATQATRDDGTAGGNSFTSGFPVDLMIQLSRAGSAHGFQDRLRGFTQVLESTNTNAESGPSSFKGDNMTGVYGVAANSNWGAELFRRAPSFFDVVCYTGTGTVGQTFTHNLGVAPEMMIVKSRSEAYGWIVYSASIGNTNQLVLNTTAASTSSNAWNNSTPTSSTFALSAFTSVNRSGTTYVAYLFATCAGVSKVGSYTGTGTTKQIDCGFTGGARFVLIKRTDSTGDWYVWDTARGIVSGNDPYLLLNSTAAEVTNTDYVDTYSAGFEISSTAPAAINASGGSFIFLAIS